MAGIGTGAEYGELSRLRETYRRISRDVYLSFTSTGFGTRSLALSVRSASVDHAALVLSTFSNDHNRSYKLLSICLAPPARNPL